MVDEMVVNLIPGRMPDVDAPVGIAGPVRGGPLEPIDPGARAEVGRKRAPQSHT